MKILLINPPFNRLKKIYTPYVPLGLQYLSGMLNAKGFHALIFNADGPDPDIKKSRPLLREKFDGQEHFISGLADDRHLIWREVRDILQQEKPGLVGITATSPVFPAAKKIAAIVKRVLPECNVVVGGIHATIKPEEVMKNPDIDFLIKGEGEQTMLELVEALSSEERMKTPASFSNIPGLFYRDKKRIVFTGDRALAGSLADFPYPARETVLNPFPHGEGAKAILATRGCVYSCKYCNSAQMWRRTIRRRTVEDIFSEMKHMAKEHKIKFFEFKDETFTLSREWVRSFCVHLQSMNAAWEWSCATRVDLVDPPLIDLMSRAGCVHMTFGIESGSPETLNKINKKMDLQYAREMCCVVKKKGMILNINMIIGLPCETEASFDEAKEIIRKINPHRIFIGSFIPLPSCELQSEYELPDISEEQWTRYSFHSWHNPSFNPHIPSDRFRRRLDDLLSYADQYNRSCLREYGQAVNRNLRKILRRVGC